jgi:hypothetical protein
MKAARSCVFFWLAALLLTGLLILVVNLVETLAHARGWW